MLIGELAPIGERARSSRSALAPLPFLRALGCVDRHYRALQTGRCRGFRPAGADALGHHPHGKRLAPDQHNPDPDEAQIGDLARLERAVDRLTAGRRLRVTAPGLRRLPLHLTEFGYQTSPPDLAAGVTLAEQAAYLQQAAYVAWKDPRVRSLSLYQWHDEPVHHRGPGVRAYSGWQSGLRVPHGRAEAGAAASSRRRSSPTSRPAAPAGGCGGRSGPAART